MDDAAFDRVWTGAGDAVLNGLAVDRSASSALLADELRVVWR